MRSRHVFCLMCAASRTSEEHGEFYGQLEVRHPVAIEVLGKPRPETHERTLLVTMGGSAHSAVRNLLSFALLILSKAPA